MKKNIGITRAILDAALGSYATIASLASYVTTAALAAYNYATQAWTTSFVQATLASAFVAFNMKDNVQYSVNYVQSSVPDGVGALEGEHCLVTGEAPAIYAFTTAWAKLADLEDTERVAFLVCGTDETEPGYTATMKIYTWEDGELNEYALVTNDIFYVDSENKQYRYNGSACVEFPTPATNLLSNAQKAAIDNANLQATDTVAKVSDIPAQQLTADELTAINNANLQATDTVAKTSVLDGYAALASENTFTESNRFTGATYFGRMDQYTKALLHFEGADGSTVFTDECGHTFSFRSSPQIDTDQHKFGSSSFYSPGTSDNLIFCYHDDFIVGNNPFCLEFFMRKKGTGNAVCSLSGLSVLNVLRFQFRSPNPGVEIYYRPSTGGDNYICQDITTYSNNVWYHIAIVGTGSAIELYRDGTLVGSSNINYNLVQGYISFCENYSFYGWIDEARLSIGTTRKPIVVPSAAYEDFVAGEINLQASDYNTKSITYTKWAKVENFQTVYSGASAPALSAGEQRVWYNTGDSKYYLVFSPDGAKKIGVEMSIFS